MKINQKDLVLVKYPFSNLENSKVRPAVVISNNKINKKSDDCILIPLTTIIKKDFYSVLITQKDVSSGRLIKESRARVDKIFSINNSLIFTRIGKLNDGPFLELKNKLIQIIS